MRIQLPMKTRLICLASLIAALAGCREIARLDGRVSATIEQPTLDTMSDGTRALNAKVRFLNTSADLVTYDDCGPTILQRQDKGSRFVDASTPPRCGVVTERDTSIEPDSERVFNVHLTTVIEGAPGTVYRINFPVSTRGYDDQTVSSATFTLPAK